MIATHGRSSVANSPKQNLRGENTRQRILNVALETFGSLGFEATSTRLLAEQAGASLPAIQYYFGSKEGLYRAVVHQIINRIEAEAESIGQRTAAAVAGSPSRTELRGLLCDLTDALVSLLLNETAVGCGSCRNFLARLDVEQSVAGDALHECINRCILTPAAAIIGCLTKRSADDEQVRMSVVAIFGQIRAFSYSRSNHLLGWPSITPCRVQAVQRLVHFSIAAMFPDRINKGEATQTVSDESQRHPESLLE